MPAACSRWPRAADRPRGPPLRHRRAARLPARRRGRGAAARLHQDRPLRDADADRGHADPRRHRAALGRPAARAAAATTTRWTSRCRWPSRSASSSALRWSRASRAPARPSSARCCSAPTSASAAEFSFFLSMPTMAGAFAFDLYKNRDVLSFDDAALIAVGFVCRLRRRAARGAAACSISFRGAATRSSAGGESCVGVAGAGWRCWLTGIGQRADLICRRFRHSWRIAGIGIPKVGQHILTFHCEHGMK